jgi:hypothetical protein
MMNFSAKNFVYSSPIITGLLSFSDIYQKTPRWQNAMNMEQVLKAGFWEFVLFQVKKTSQISKNKERTT